MPEKNTAKRKNTIYLILIMAIVAVIAITVIVIFYRQAETESDSELRPGQEYIRSLEQTDTSEIENKIRDIRAEKLKADVENGDVNIWQMFDDVAIVGDSRAEAFESYEVLDSRHVISKIGHSVKWILEEIDEFKAALTSLDPSYIVLVFGLNDVDKGMDVEEYIEQVDDVITQFHELLPDATIYLNSIIPTTQHAVERHPNYANIPSWNDTVKAYCEEHDIPYIDITDTVEAHTDLYDTDGVHMRKEFLEYWAVDIITEIMKNEQ